MLHLYLSRSVVLALDIRWIGSPSFVHAQFVVHMEIILLKSEQFDELMAAAAEARELAPPETDQPLQ